MRFRRSPFVEGIERGSRIRSFLDGVPRQAAELAVLIGAVLVSVIGLGWRSIRPTQLNELLPVNYGAIFQLDNPFGEVGAVIARESPAFWQLLVGHVAQWILVSVAPGPGGDVLPVRSASGWPPAAALGPGGSGSIHGADRAGDIEAKYGSQIEASFGDLAPGLRAAGCAAVVDHR